MHSKMKDTGVKTKPKNTGKAVKQLAAYCKNYWWTVLIAMICAICAAVLSILGPSKIQDLTAIIQDGLNKALGLGGAVEIDMQAVFNVCITLVIMYACSLLLNYIQHFIMTSVSCRITNKLRGEISRKINKVPLKYFDTHNFGDTLSCVTNDADTISSSLGNSIGSLVSAVTMLIGCTVMMFVTQWIMAFTAIGASLIGFIIMMIIMARSQKYFNARQDSLAAVNGHVEEYYAGHNVVKVYNGEQAAGELFNEKNAKLEKNTFMAEFMGGLMGPLMAFIGNLGYVAVCVVGAALAFNHTAGVDFTVVVAFMIYVRLFTSPLSQIAQGMTSIQAAASASERVFGFIGGEELSDESDKTQKIENVSGDVEFINVNFGYTPEKTIINDFSAKIKAGQKVAIVGPTGAGKTTMVNLLMRFYELNSGKITVDGISIADVTRENVHDLFGMVLQDTWLFEGTVRENLTYGRKDLSDFDILRCVKAVGLEHFVNTLPKGLDTVLNDAVTISAGQKQLLTIARAMIENAPMLILDEATSSVDTRTEQQIQRAMNKLTEGRTSFVIAHRLSTIRDADMIIYMKGGDIKETGTHDELLKRNGMYAELYNSQFQTA